MPATKSRKKPQTTEKTTMPEPTLITGYRPRQRSRWATMSEELIEVEEGAEPFTARIRSHLTFGEIEEIPSPFMNGTSYPGIEQAIVDYVLDWNVLATNAETGQLEKVPPPAEAGVEAFKFLSGLEIEWLALELRKTSPGDPDELYRKERDGVITPEEADRKKGSTTSVASRAPSASSSS